MTIDLTPEEFAQVYGETESDDLAQASQDTLRMPPVSAIVAAHFNSKQMERVKEYARHLAGQGQRVGLIVADAAEFKLICFDGVTEAGSAPEAQSSNLNPTASEIQAAINELSFDLDRWLLLVPNYRSAEARELLAATDHWVLLSTCDHDGVVACYRTLKGLSGLHRPRLSLAVLEALGLPDAGRIHHKLAAVCQEFLGIPLEEETPVKKFRQAAEFEVMSWKPQRDQALAAGATAPWRVVSQFLARVRAQQQQPAAPQASPAAANPAMAIPAMAMPVQPLPAASAVAADETIPQVIELAGQSADAAAIIAAVLRAEQGQFVECPLLPPACPQARLAVGRDRALVMLAVAKAGLAELRDIALAYRWMADNRALIAMALPQLAIDVQQSPRLRLLIDQADVSADALHHLLQSATVQVQTYRRVRWGDKQGLLLEAA
jgi:hypothetical protein